MSVPFPRRIGQVVPFLKQSPAFHGMIVRTAGIGIAFVQALLLARTTAADVYGAYSVGMSVASLLATVGCLGFCPLAVREIAKEKAKHEDGNPLGFMAKTLRIVVSAAVILAIVVSLTVSALPNLGSGMIRYAVLMSIPVMFMLSINRLASSLLRGIGAPIHSQASQVIFRPAIFVLLLLLLIIFMSSPSLPALFAAATLASTFAMGVTLLLVQRKTRGFAGSTGKSFETCPMLGAAIPFFLASTVAVAHNEIPTIILGAFNGATEAGLLQPIARIGLALTIGHIVVSHPLAPKVAGLWQQRRTSDVQTIVQRAARKSLLITTPIAIFVAVFSELLLGIFGERFMVGAPGLAALAVAQLINSATGYGGILLGMTKHQGTATKIQALSLLLTVFLVIVLSDHYGVNGAAFAMAAGIIVSNIALSLTAWRLTRINSFAIG